MGVVVDRLPAEIPQVPIDAAALQLVEADGMGRAEGMLGWLPGQCQGEGRFSRPTIAEKKHLAAATVATADEVNVVKIAAHGGGDVLLVIGPLRKGWRNEQPAPVEQERPRAGLLRIGRPEEGGPEPLLEIREIDVVERRRQRLDARDRRAAQLQPTEPVRPRAPRQLLESLAVIEDHRLDSLRPHFQLRLDRRTGEIDFAEIGRL